MQTFVILMQGGAIETAEPLLYSDDPEAVKALVSFLAERASAGLLPELKTDAEAQVAELGATVTLGQVTATAMTGEDAGPALASYLQSPGVQEPPYDESLVAETPVEIASEP